MKRLGLILLVIGVLRADGQRLDTIVHLLKSRDMKGLVSYEQLKDKPYMMEWRLNRSVIGDYKEGILFFRAPLKGEVRKGKLYYYAFTVNLLSRGDRIFYYRLVQYVPLKYPYDDGLGEPHPIDSLSDEVDYRAFQALFIQTYGDTARREDLMRTDVIYGSHCGFAGVNPPEKIQMDSLIRNRHIDIIRQWLCSANAEKQLYALRGYRVLTSQGYELTTQEKRILDLLRKKDCMVSECGGCVYMSASFGREVNNIDTTKIEWLMPEKPEKPVEAAIQWKSYAQELFAGGVILVIGIFLVCNRKRRE